MIRSYGDPFKTRCLDLGTESDKLAIFVCVCVCVRACVRVFFFVMLSKCLKIQVVKAFDFVDRAHGGRKRNRGLSRTWHRIPRGFPSINSSETKVPEVLASRGV